MRDIIAIGGSAGAVEAVQRILPSFKADFPGSFFIALHRAPTGRDHLAEVLSRVTQLKVVSPMMDQSIENGHIYIAPPNRHLVVKRGRVTTTLGPSENRSRPSIDVTFRSVARSYGRRVIGVLLTGYLDDGTAGLGVIRDEGGTTVVQDPEDSTAPDMPANAMRYVAVDHVVRLAEMEQLVMKLAATSAAQHAREGIMEDRKRLPSTLTCPACGGSIHILEGGGFRQFECEIGHAYSPRNMSAAQAELVEERLWSAVRTLKEREAFLRSEIERLANGQDRDGADALKSELSDTTRKVKEVEKLVTG